VWERRCIVFSIDRRLLFGRGSVLKILTLGKRGFADYGLGVKRPELEAHKTRYTFLGNHRKDYKLVDEEWH
jgi:hypothetical protein